MNLKKTKVGIIFTIMLLLYNNVIYTLKLIYNHTRLENAFMIIP